MRAECLSFADVPHLSRLYQDVLSGDPKVRAFYPKTPFVRDFSKWRPARTIDPRTADVLTRQNRAFGASAATLANLERLRAGAAAVVTGQQVTVFGGQLLAYLKALTAIKLAAEATAAGVPSVPVFWLATEDHDLPEVTHVRTLNHGHQLLDVSLTLGAAAESPVGQIPLGPSVEPALARMAEALGASDIMQLLRETYTPEATLGHSYGYLFEKLFAPFGLVLIDNSDPELHAIEQPLLSLAAERATELNDALLARGKELEHAGYHAQVKVTKASTLLFAQHDGARKPVQRANGQYAISEERLSAQELVARVSAYPERFSANALFRPVVQDYLLPTLAYVGGPAEVAYFAQSEVIYQRLLGRVTSIVPRVSATIVESKIEGLLQEYRLSIKNALVPDAELRELIGKRSLPADLPEQFSTARSRAAGWGQELRASLLRLDPTLADAATTAFSKIQYQLSRLERRAAAANVRKHEESARHATRISNALFPHHNLQEREIAGAYFLARYGHGFLDDLYAVIDTRCLDHQLLFPGA